MSRPSREPILTEDERIVRDRLAKARAIRKPIAIPAENPWLQCMPVRCCVCELLDRGHNWTQWIDFNGHAWVAHTSCLKDPVRQMLQRRPA